MRKSLLLGAGLLFAGTAAAQGTDTCTAPTAVGEGSFAFDNTAAVGSSEMTCTSGYDMNQDLFWVYTATVAGDIQFDTIGSTFDTQIAIFSGTDCTATCVDDDDDGGGNLTSSVTALGVNVGDQFVVQVGGYAANSGTGTLNITQYVDPCSVADDSYEDNEDCATAAPIGDGMYTNLFTSKTDDDQYSICVPDGATIDVSIFFSDATSDIDLFLWDAAGIDCGGGLSGAGELTQSTSVSDDETITWTNNTGANLDVVIEVAPWDLASNGECNTYDMSITRTATCGPTSDGTPFCNPMDANSTGLSTTLTGTLGTGVESGLRLDASNGVPAEFGYFLIGTGVDDPGIVISGGRLCLAVTGGNQFGRYNFGTTTNSIGLFDAAGNFQNLVGTATSNGGYGYDVASTNPLGGTISSGQSWHFQLWHRDTPAGAGSSNFSNGLTVTF